MLLKPYNSLSIKHLHKYNLFAYQHRIGVRKDTCDSLRHISKTYLIHQFVVKVWHFQIQKTSCGFLKISWRQILLQEQCHLTSEVLYRSEPTTHSPHIVQSYQSMLHWEKCISTGQGLSAPQKHKTFILCCTESWPIIFWTTSVSYNGQIWRKMRHMIFHSNSVCANSIQKLTH